MMPFDEYATVMGMYIESAKTYLQLSTFALGFSLAFLEKLRSKKGVGGQDWRLILSWLGFMLTVAFSSFYQYLAVKLLDQRSSDPGSLGIIPEAWVRSPGKFYAAMLVSFYLGILALSLLMFGRSGDAQEGRH